MKTGTARTEERKEKLRERMKMWKARRYGKTVEINVVLSWFIQNDKIIPIFHFILQNLL